MAHSTAILIKECKNGFIVKPGEVDNNCVIGDENYQVFESYESLFKFIEEHFAESEQ